MSFRWYGTDDPVTLKNIRQIPGMQGIVSAIYDVPVGDSWSYERIMALKNMVTQAGLQLSVIESVPVHEDIKLGLPTRDVYIENYRETLRNLARADVRVVCYNFMPVFDWTRSELSYELPDGSFALSYDEPTVARMDPTSGELNLPGWDTSYENTDLHRLMAQYRELSEEGLWENLAYFVKAVMPVAEEVGVRMAIHPDDPPWSIFGLPRIITNQRNLQRFVELYDHPVNGLCVCSGSLGANPENDIPAILRHFGAMDRVNFVHARNVKWTGEKSFHESAHRSASGSLDMVAIVRALADIGYKGPIRPDHGRMIWGETGRAGYGLYDRALGAMYLQGIWEALA